MLTAKTLTLITVAVALIGTGTIVLLLAGGHGPATKATITQPEAPQAHQTSRNQAPTASITFPRNDLRLPFNISDIDPQNGEINPLGVVRFAKDQGEFGHSGIDVPLVQNAPIYAVADGPIVTIKSAGDPWGGQGIWQLLEPTSDGEGWAYIYEHVTPAAGINESSNVKAGDLIATKTAPAGFTAHFQLSYVFNNFEFSRGMECWPNHLSEEASNQLTVWWNQRRTSDKLIEAWRTNDEEGKFPFRGLLDTDAHPNGPQLCYPPGTDVR